jgi:transcriptional regulator with XRE-family HTH domain
MDTKERSTSKKETKSDLGRTLSSLITKAGFSQTDFADAIELTPEQLSRIIRGRSGTSADTLERMLGVLNITDAKTVGSIYRLAGFAPPVSVALLTGDGKVYVYPDADPYPTLPSDQLTEIQSDIRNLQTEVRRILEMLERFNTK